MPLGALDREDLAAQLRAELGWDWVSAPTSGEYTVDGLRPAVVAMPHTFEDVAAAVAEAERLGLAVIARGHGSHAHVGNVPRRYDLALSTRRLARVTEHNAADMTVTVQAGVTVEALATALGASRQWLPIDVPRPDRVTVGGLIAADLNGGLRYSQGKVRDHLIGVRAVIGGGRMLRGGGKVVKNVAGYDIPKLMAGSFGTLGIIVEASLKVRPRPVADVTLAAPAASIGAACERAAAVVDGPLAALVVDVLSASAAAAAGLHAEPHLIVRLGGEATEVRQQTDRLSRFVRRLEPADEATCVALRDLDLQGTGTVSCRVSLLPAAMRPLIEAIEREAPRFGCEPFIHAHAGNGIIRLRVIPGDQGMGGALRLFRWLRFATRQLGGFVVLEDVPRALKDGLDVWGDSPAPVELMRRVKQALDPLGTFSPGRFVGRI